MVVGWSHEVLISDLLWSFFDLSTLALLEGNVLLLPYLAWSLIVLALHHSSLVSCVCRHAILIQAGNLLWLRSTWRLRVLHSHSKFVLLYLSLRACVHLWGTYSTLRWATELCSLLLLSTSLILWVLHYLDSFLIFHHIIFIKFILLHVW